MIVTGRKTNISSFLQIQSTTQRRGAGIILAIFCVMFLLATVGTQRAQAQTFTTIYKFCSQTDSSGTCPDGSYPRAGLVQGSDGNFYGTTSVGGVSNGSLSGTVFKITPSGNLTTLHDFCLQGYPCPDGEGPYAPLIQGSDGNFYGTTLLNFSTVFKITPGGALTTLYTFCYQTNCAIGNGIYGALVQGTDGNFYGTTAGGGSYYGGGVVFRITPDGQEETLYTFCDQGDTSCPDGVQPLAGLVQGTDGDFYGTTAEGGAGSDGGTVFKITSAGVLTTLYSFCTQTNCPDGYRPFARLVRGSDGNFYGTTDQGGAHGAGTVFKITPTGTLTTVYDFCSQDSCVDGRGPDAGLIQASDGNFYGTTNHGGANLAGTIFKITPAGTLTTLYSFCSQDGCADGAYPEAGLVQAADGNLYGTTYGGGNGTSGGAVGYGTVFRITLAPSAPSVTLSDSGLAFGSVPIGIESASEQVTVTNTGTAGLVFNAGAVTLSGANASDFFITSDGCSGQTIGWTAPNNTCSVGVAFKPSNATTESALLNFADNASGSPQTVALSGTGLTPQQVTQSIINQVNNLSSKGVINNGQDNSLVKELQKAIDMMNAGKISGAIANLEDFIAEVNDMSSSGVLTPAQAGALVNAANGVIAQLQTL